MIKRVALFTSFGIRLPLPEEAEKVFLKDEMGARFGLLIDIFDDLPNNNMEYVARALEFLKEDTEDEAMIRADKTVVYKIKESKRDKTIQLSNASSYTVAEVDISRPWTIAVYDGSEIIHYLDTNKLIDERFNYYEIQGD